VLIDSNDVLYHRAPAQWLPGDHFQITLAPIYIGWQRGSWEGYFGWRDREGHLDLSLSFERRNTDRPLMASGSDQQRSEERPDVVAAVVRDHRRPLWTVYGSSGQPNPGEERTG
jgi:hypothetical protein